MNRDLRDPFLTAVDIPRIQTVLHDRIPRTSEHARNRVINHLSEKRRSAGSAVAHLDYFPELDVLDLSANYAYLDDDEVRYTLGQSYNGYVRREVKEPCNRSSRSYR